MLRAAQNGRVDLITNSNVEDVARVIMPGLRSVGGRPRGLGS